jgi:nitrogen fixation protein FixH
MHWGHGIAIFFTCFVAFMIFMVVKSFQQNIDLVTENYYEQELKFQQQIDKINNNKGLEEAVAVKFSDGAITITFPKMNNIQGDIHVFRPSDAQFDLERKIDLDLHSSQIIPVASLPAGFYRVKINWSAEGKEFYTEETINIR